MKIIAILPSFYSPRSNGIIILLKIYACIASAGICDVIFLAQENDKESIDEYRRRFGHRFYSYSDIHCLIAGFRLTAQDFILVRPDDLEGILNPIHWVLAGHQNARAIVNILLAPPYGFARHVRTERYYGVKDYFVVYNKAILPGLGMPGLVDAYIEPRLDSLLMAFINRPASAGRLAVYCGKSMPRIIPGLTKAVESLDIDIKSREILYIGRNNPCERVVLYRWLLSAAMLVSFDPFSHIERVATAIGTPVFKPNGFSSEEIPGVFTSFSRLIAASSQGGFRCSIARNSYKDYIKKLSMNTRSLERILTAISFLVDCGGNGGSSMLLPPSLLGFGHELQKRFGNINSGLRNVMSPPQDRATIEAFSPTDIKKIIMD